MATSTLLTLLVVPVVYVLVDTAIERVRVTRARLMARFRRGRGEAPPAARELPGRG
jgi:hypothetical protein